jgi:hypothetical protein
MPPGAAIIIAAGAAGAPYERSNAWGGAEMAREVSSTITRSTCLGW